MDRQTRTIEDVYSRRYQSFRGALAGIVGSYELAFRRPKSTERPETR